MSVKLTGPAARRAERGSYPRRGATALALFVFLLALLALSAPPLLAQVPGAPAAEEEGQEGETQPEAEAPAPPPDLENPRATFSTFLDAMTEFYETGRIEHLRRAARTFAATGDETVREQVGMKAARRLKEFLDRYEFVELETIPTETEETIYYWRFLDEGQVSLVRMPDGRWLFSKETIDSLDALIELVRDRQVVEGVTAAPATLSDWLRGHMPAVMKERLFFLENWQWIGLLLLAILGVIVERIVSSIVISRLRILLDRSRVPLSGEVLVKFQRPLAILSMAVVWSLLLGILDLPIGPYEILLRAIRLVIGVSGVWALYRAIDVIAALLATKAAKTDTRMDDLLVPLIRRALKLVVVAFGVLFVAQNLDVNVTSLIAGISIGGIAFALAAKDTVENVFGSLTVLIDRPFQIGDWVKIGEVDGTVVEVGFRSTRVRTFYNSLITVPNSKLVNAAIDNMGAREYRRVKAMISVQYDTKAEKIEAFCEGIRELIRRHPYTRKDYYMVYFNQFAGSSLDVLLYAFVKTPDWPTELRERHRLFLDVVRLAERLGIDFAFPTQTLHVASVPPGVGGYTPPAAAAGGPQDADEAIAIGRREAQAIYESAWEQGIQPTADIGDPDRIPPR